MNERLNTIGTYIPLNIDVCNAVWENVAHLITHTLVEGYSKLIIYIFLRVLNILSELNSTDRNVILSL